MTARLFLKLIAASLCLLLVALLTVDLFVSRVARQNYMQNLTRQLVDKSRMLQAAAPPPAMMDQTFARRMATAAGGRVTVVRSDGVVLADSEADPARMENHMSRPELARSFRGLAGSNERRSATLGVPFLYVAAPARDGVAIRVAVPLADIAAQVSSLRWKVLASAGLAFVPAIFLAAALARYLSRRFAAIMAHAQELARGNFRARLPRGDTSEFGQLAGTLNETAENLQRTVEQLQREHAELEKLERVRKDFVINVSHELRTPLASIQGYAETLLDGAIDDPSHNVRFLKIIHHNAERLARLTEDLLTLSRVEQRRQKLEFAHWPVNGMLRDAMELMRPIAAKRGVKLAAEPAPEGATAWCDNEAVSQVLSNLLDNAVKYTPAGGRIVIGARLAGEFVEFHVRDTGIGIPEDDLPRLFERFYRVDKARSRELGGTGLGLAIVKHLVAALGGTTRVESRVNEGSTFFFTLPVTEIDAGASQVNSEFTAL